VPVAGFIFTGLGVAVGARCPGKSVSCRLVSSPIPGSIHGLMGLKEHREILDRAENRAASIKVSL
jgi:hypothetical protein